MVGVQIPTLLCKKMAKKSYSCNLPVQTLLWASTIVIQTLVDIIARLFLATHQLKPDARVVGEVHQVDPQVPGFNSLGQVHDGHGSTVQDPEFDGGVVDVTELAHLVGQVVGVHEPDGGGEGQGAVLAKNSLDSESPMKQN